MLKKRIKTLSLTLALFLIYVLIGNLNIYGYIDTYPRFARTMLVFTMIQVLGGCMLQTAGLSKLSLWLSTIVFIILCTCLFYSTKWYDFATFAVCVYIVVKRSANVCDCMLEDIPPKQKNTEDSQPIEDSDQK